MEWVAHLCRERKAFRPGSAHPSITRIHIRENSSIYPQSGDAESNLNFPFWGRIGRWPHAPDRSWSLGRCLGVPSSSVVIRRHLSSSVTFTR